MASISLEYRLVMTSRWWWWWWQWQIELYFCLLNNDDHSKWCRAWSVVEPVFFRAIASLVIIISVLNSWSSLQPDDAFWGNCISRHFPRLWSLSLHHLGGCHRHHHHWNHHQHHHHHHHQIRTGVSLMLSTSVLWPWPPLDSATWPQAYQEQVYKWWNVIIL